MVVGAMDIWVAWEFRIYAPFFLRRSWPPIDGVLVALLQGQCLGCLGSQNVVPTNAGKWSKKIVYAVT